MTQKKHFQCRESRMGVEDEMVVSEQHGNPVGQTTNPADPCQISRACESSIF